MERTEDISIIDALDLPCDCSKIKLSKSVRHWLGNQVFLKLQTVEELHELHNISKSNLRRWAKQTREGRKFYESAGRPPILTLQGEQLLAMIIDYEGLDIDQISTDELGFLVQLARVIDNKMA
jgi:hypothetical protein